MKTHRSNPVALSLPFLAASFATLVLPVYGELPGATAALSPAPPPPTAPGSASKSPAAPAPEKTPEAKQLEELLKLKFERNPAAILQALEFLASPAAASKSPIEQYRMAVVAGRWKQAGEFIKTLPAKDGVQVYSQLLKELNQVSTQQQQLQQQGIMLPTPSPTMLLDDVVAVADISPAPLNDEQLGSLGGLLGRVLTVSSYLEPLLQQLEKGTMQLGGQEPAKRELAAQLLLNVGRDIDAAKFLPALEVGRETASLPLLEKHVRCTFTRGRNEQKKDEIQRAWDLNQMLLGAADCPPDLRERAWSRAMEMTPLIPVDAAVQWMKDLFAKEPQKALSMLTAVGNQVGKDRSNRDIEQRKKNLSLLRQIVESLLPAADQREQWQPVLNLFALNWIEEADYSKRYYMSPRNNQMQYDQFGNPMYYGQQQMQQQNPNMLPLIPPADMLPLAPTKEWMESLDAGRRPRVIALMAELNLKIEDDAAALPWIEQLAAFQPKETLNLANELLRVWANSHDPTRMMPQRNRNQMMYYNPYGRQQQQGIPLTRALQQRYLEELGVLLKRLKALPIEALDDKAIVAAFTTAHSPAEVFSEEAVERVLGKVNDIKPETLAQLLQTMRERLAGLWRKPAVQQQLKTQRKDAQIDAEVLRGYELLGGLIQKGLERQPEDWRLNLTQACTLFDWAEFQYGKKVDLAIYVEKREKAFEAFQKSAGFYTAKVPTMPRKEETPVIFQQWLNANLGASDLAFVTRQQETSDKNLDRIRDAIKALPGDASQRHMSLLAKAILDGAESLPANMKPAYMRAAKYILGETPEADGIRKLVSYHEGLLREIELSVRVDGDTTVGHGQPFGAFVTARHTVELERENAGGFAKYLQNMSQNPYYYNPYGTMPVDHRDEFEKQMREKLSESFEVLNITFHDEKVQSRGYGRNGWRETPLAYLLLKPKDGATDRLPSFHLDMDFVDAQGPVILPVESQVQLIDARQKTVPVRPLIAPETVQILDDRALNEGRLTLEVKVTGKGLVPTFGELFEFAPKGFKVDELTDNGMVVQRLDSEGDELAAASERSWLIKLIADKTTGSQSSFAFPKPKQADMKVAYKRYQDADLVDVPAETAIVGIPLGKNRYWLWALAAVVVGAPVSIFVAKRARRSESGAVRANYSLPSTITPFTTLELLRKMYADEQLSLSNEERLELSKAIGSIESHFFARTQETEPSPDLESIGKNWVQRTSAGITV